MKQFSIYLLLSILSVLMGCSSIEKPPKVSDVTFKLKNQYTDYDISSMRLNTTTFVHQFDDVNQSAQVTFDDGNDVKYIFSMSYNDLHTKTFTLPEGDYTLRIRPTEYDLEGSSFLYYSVNEVVSITAETTSIEVTGTTEQSLIIVNSDDVSDGYISIYTNESDKKALVTNEENEGVLYIYVAVNGYLAVYYNKLGDEIRNVILDPKSNVKYLFNYGGDQGITVNLDDLYKEEIIFP